MSAGRMPSTVAQAADLSGCALRKSTICRGSQLPCRRVPPYRPGVPPEKVPPLPCGGLSPGWSVPTGGMNGLAPGVASGSRATAVEADVPVRVSAATVPDRISTTTVRIPTIALRESRPRLPREPARGPTLARVAAGPSGPAASDSTASPPPGTAGGVVAGGSDAGGGSAFSSGAPHAVQKWPSVAAAAPQEVQKRPRGGGTTFVDGSGSSEFAPVGDGSHPCRPGTAAPPSAFAQRHTRATPDSRGRGPNPLRTSVWECHPTWPWPAHSQPGGTDDRGGRTPARLRAGAQEGGGGHAASAAVARAAAKVVPGPFIRGIANRPATAGSASPPNHHIQGKRGEDGLPPVPALSGRPRPGRPSQAAAVTSAGGEVIGTGRRLAAELPGLVLQRRSGRRRRRPGPGPRTSAERGSRCGRTAPRWPARSSWRRPP